MTIKLPETLRPYAAKRWLWAYGTLAAIVLLLAVAWNVEFERAMPRQKLPAAAQEFLSTHYPQEKVALVRWEYEEFGITYQVVFSNGTKVEFLRNGEMKKVKSRLHPVPEAVVPEAICSYVAETFPGTFITEIEHKRHAWKVELNNMVELSFDDRGFYLTDYDD